MDLQLACQMVSQYKANLLFYLLACHPVHDQRGEAERLAMVKLGQEDQAA